MTVGILVAMVIALTLWIGSPGRTSHVRPLSPESAIPVAKSYVEYFAGILQPRLP